MFFVREICIESVVGVWMKSGNNFRVVFGAKKVDGVVFSGTGW